MKYLYSITAVGEFVIVDQFIDRTFQRSKTFFDQECVAHVSVANPVCHRLGDMCRQVMCALQLIRDAVAVLVLKRLQQQEDEEVSSK